MHGASGTSDLPAPHNGARARPWNAHTRMSPVPLDDLLTLLVDLPDTTLACTHREVFEKLFGWDVTCEKGGTWVLERKGDELVPSIYLEPPAVVSGDRRALRSV